ncbi:MAG: hypothetical protein N2440_03150 [Actinobacteria bacterium]|nr:hypothetical protein [Actinomycetota bacterium]
MFHYLGFDEFSLGGFDFHLFFFAAIAAYFAFFLNFFSYIMVLIFTGLINTLLETRANFQENIILFLTIIVIFLFLKVFVSTYRKKKSISRYFAFLDFVSIYVSLSLYHIAFHFFILKKPIPYILKSSEFYYSTIIIVFAVLLLEQLHQISSQKENVKERNILFKFIIIPFLVFIFALSVVVFVSNSYLIFTFNKIESSTRNVFNNEAIYSSHLYGQIFMRTFEGAKNYCRSLVKLPGVQWRTKNLIALARQRIEEFFSMGVDIGVDSYFIISEKGNLELYVGLKPSYSSVNKIFEQVNSVYPGTYSKDAISLKVFDNIDNKIYFCMPIFRTTTNPAGGLKPDGKRNGFLVCAIDLNYMLESVQRNLNQKSRLHFFVYEYGGKFNVVSHSLSISDLTKKKMELAKESAIKIAEKAVRSDNQVVFVKDNFVQAAYPVGGLRNLCSVAFLPIESYSRRIEDAKRNLRRLILSSSLFSFFIALAVFSFFSIFASILQNQLKLKEKELEEEIERKYEILETVLKDLPLGILLVNSEGEIKFSNDFGKFFIQRETGKTPDTIKNTSFEHVLEIFQSDVDLKRTEIVSGSRIYGTTARIVDFKGEKLLNIVLSDITEIRQIQQAALVESRSIILGELAKNFSTMISDPLQLALAKLEVLIAKFKDDRNIIEFLKDIEDSLEKVVEASYGIGSLSSGVVQYEEGMISIKDIMKRVIDIMKPSFNRYGIEFELKIEDEKMLFKGILSRLELILVSILSMAINLLQVNNLEENKKIQIEVKPLDGMGRIIVNWIGHQLTKEEIEMLGKPYYTESTKGRILNLFVAKQLAIKEGGTLEVHRSENGMVVILDYPLAE